LSPAGQADDANQDRLDRAACGVFAARTVACPRPQDFGPVVSASRKQAEP